MFDLPSPFFRCSPSRLVARAGEGDAGGQAAVVPDACRERPLEGGHRGPPGRLLGAVGVPGPAARAIEGDRPAAGQEGEACLSNQSTRRWIGDSSNVHVDTIIIMMVPQIKNIACRFLLLLAGPRPRVLVSLFSFSVLVVARVWYGRAIARGGWGKRIESKDECRSTALVGR